MTKGKYERLWFWMGSGLMALSMVPYLILGEDSVFTYHDQLDGEMIAYILQARHLFSGDMLPEFMGGMWKTSLTMPAPGCVLLFLGGHYFAALLIMQLIGRLVGFGGMYLSVRELTGSAPAGAVAGVLYGFLPFLPVYGLSQYGIPLLLWCVLRIRENRRAVPAWTGVILYALNSSLVLVGFGLLGAGVPVLIWEFLRYRKKKEEKGAVLRLGAVWLLLLGIYAAENFRLLAQMLSSASVSHKSEYVLAPEPFWEAFRQNLFSGGQHSEGYQGILAVVLPVAAAAGFLILRFAGRAHFSEALQRRREEIGGNLKRMGICLGCNVLLAFGAALWSSSFGVGIRSRLGALGAFRFDRILWMAPCLWYLAFACGAAALWNLWKEYRGRRIRAAAGICLICLIPAVGVTGIRILLAGDIKSNVQKLRNPDYGMLSFRDYYAMGVMEQVRDFLAEETGKTQEEYRVVSLGIDPAAALYHGFYCLDGYSNHYSADYKHRFRRIIAPELEKSDYLRDYFDGWGNRCYLFSAECPGYFTIEKNGFYFQDYRTDTEALKEMGCDYLLSAAWIQNAEEQGLWLMNEEAFETANSYYRIFVYKTEDSGKEAETDD